MLVLKLFQSSRMYEYFCNNTLGEKSCRYRIKLHQYRRMVNEQTDIQPPHPRPTLLPGVLGAVNTSWLLFQRGLLLHESQEDRTALCVVPRSPMNVNVSWRFFHVSTYSFSVLFPRLCPDTTLPLVSRNGHLTHVSSLPHQGPGGASQVFLWPR